MALSSYRTYNNNAPRNLSNDEFIALQNFSKKGLLCLKGNSVVILGNSVLIVDRQDYIKQINNFSYQKKFAMVNMNDDTLLNFAVNQEKHVEKVLEKLVESVSMTEENKKSLKPVASRPCFMYCSCKAHKPSVENFPPLPKVVGFEHSHLQSCEILGANFKTFVN